MYLHHQLVNQRLNRYIYKQHTTDPLCQLGYTSFLNETRGVADIFSIIAGHVTAATAVLG